VNGRPRLCTVTIDPFAEEGELVEREDRQTLRPRLIERVFRPHLGVSRDIHMT
jgi:hypothetical protein